VITEGKQFPEHSLIIGSPARVVRTLDLALAAQIGDTVKFYVGNGARYKKGVKKIG
jgi:carbonic anhydrase/acetyltransferase-like protein (isoleucine patch superfamily)